MVPRLQLRDLDTGRTQRFDYGLGTVAEEHIVVLKPDRPGRRGEREAWLLGTTFDVAKGVTRMNLLDARHLEDGLVAQATLRIGCLTASTATSPRREAPRRNAARHVVVIRGP